MAIFVIFFAYFGQNLVAMATVNMTLQWNNNFIEVTFKTH